VYTATLPPFPAITAGEDVRGLNSGKEENFSSKLTVCRTLSIPSSLVALRKNLLVEFGVVGVIIIGGGMQEDTLLWLLLMLLEGFIPEVGVVILCCGGGRLVEEEGCCVSKLVLFCGGSNLGLTRCCWQTADLGLLLGGVAGPPGSWRVFMAGVGPNTNGGICFAVAGGVGGSTVEARDRGGGRLDLRRLKAGEEVGVEAVVEGDIEVRSVLDKCTPESAANLIVELRRMYFLVGVPIESE
jgi:hypothetical protein